MSSDRRYPQTSDQPLSPAALDDQILDRKLDPEEDNNPAVIQITVFTSTGGPITKSIEYTDGKVVSIPAAAMWKGSAKRVWFSSFSDLALVISPLGSHQALGMAALRPELGDEVTIVVEDKVKKGAAGISRTADNFTYIKGRPALVLLDYDTKAMPAEAKKQLLDRGGFQKVLVSILPELGSIGYLTRASTSAGLLLDGKPLPGSDNLGQHVYIIIKDGTDVVRFLTTLHDRCWLAGFGWMMIGAAGQLLERSIVDRTVGGTERLAFEGPPVLKPPLSQDLVARRPVVVEGGALDSVAALRPLTVVEKQNLGKLKAAARAASQPEANQVREKWIAERLDSLIKRGISAAAARVMLEKQTQSILLASIELPFDDSELEGVTVGDVMDDPAKYQDETLADPLEGIDYGRCKAVVIIGTEGPFITSCAHGSITVYQLKYDADAVRRRIAMTTTDVVETFVRLVLLADLSVIELHDLIDEVKRRTNRGVKLIKEAIKAAKTERAGRCKEEIKQRRAAESNDDRVELIRQPDDAPLTGEMARINEALSSLPMEQQPRRDMEGRVVKPRWKPVPETHAFDDEEEKDKEKAPEQWTIGALEDYALTEELERFLNYVDDTGRSVAPPMRLVKAYTKRNDGVLSFLAAIASQPIVLADGKVIGRETKYDQKRGIQFIVSDTIAATVPTPEQCTPEAVKKAMEYLTDIWLVDVNTTYFGKCVAIATAMTIMERSLLPERPVFGFKAGRRESGKTTLIKMIILAVTGIKPSGSPWSPDVNERRKAIMSYFLSGVAYILWDNIPKGSQISCPHIELSCSFLYFSDRLLGVSETVRIACATIHLLTGNGIGVKGDLASRTLWTEILADRADPANRNFAHPFPEQWTIDNRGEILRALYTIMIGNPMLNSAHDAQMQTRFPMWYRLVGSAIENATRLVATGEKVEDPATLKTAVEISFKKMFKEERGEDEDDTTLSDVLLKMIREWPDPDVKSQSAQLKSATIAEFINNPSPSELKTLLRELLFSGLPTSETVSPDAVGKRLAAQVGNVVECEGRNVVLRSTKPRGGGGRAAKVYYVEFIDGLPPPDEKF